MKVGIYTPYSDILGGGERYIVSVAECLSQRGHQVDVFWTNKNLKQKLADRFSLDLGKVNFVKSIFESKTTRLAKWRVTKKYGTFFFVSDGSLPFLFAKKNILHFQVPFTNIGGRSKLNQIKLRKIDEIICNSDFTKKYIDQEFGVKSRVIYPPVDVENLKPLRKKNIILSVGRLGEPLNNKKQEVLIDGFKKMKQADEAGLLKSWRLVLVVAFKKEHERFLKVLKRQAKDLPIEFMVNARFEDLKKVYGQAKVYWHAAGFGETDPARMEHFGMVVVEAMAAGAVPVVIKKGGIPGIVDHGQNGLLWETKDELSQQTLQLIRSPKLWQKLSKQAIKDSRKFSKQVFCRKIDALLED